MAEYSTLTRQLAAVRRAWKRTAAMSGLAVTCLETSGVLTLALLVDVVYKPAQTVRLGLLLAVTAAFAVLFARHVIRPLLRRISDEQMALFVEEHNDSFEGSLITATEFGPRAGASAGPGAAAEGALAGGYFVEAVIQSAIQRATRVNMRAILDLRRLRKYAVLAVVVLAGYGAVCLAFPDARHHASRVLTPWQASMEDMTPLTPSQLALRPITFTLSRGNANIPRGGSFDLEATLSRPSDDPVAINFRPSADKTGPWRTLPMAEIDRVNAYRGVLNDVTEDMELFVSSGSHRSTAVTASVYDPLVVQGMQLLTRYPSYLQLSDKAESLGDTGSPDVAAPEGSKVTFRVLANAPILSGKITWKDGSTLPLTVDNANPKAKNSAYVSFEVKQDTSYTFEIADALGQHAENANPAYIRALKDGPPTLEMKRPLGPVMMNPLGEVMVAAEAVDDLALAGVELVYERQLATGDTQTRLPMSLVRSSAPGNFPDIEQATLRFAMEDLAPAVKPEEVISYYLEATDRKGQKAVSDIRVISIGYYDNWSTISAKPPHADSPKVIKDIEEYLRAAWKLQQTKPALKPEEFAAACKALAATMIDPDTNSLFHFYDPELVPQAKRSHADRADQFIGSGHKKLDAADAEGAVKDFRVALAEITFLGLANQASQMMFNVDSGAMAAKRQKELKKLFEAISVKLPDSTAADQKQNADAAKKAEEMKADAAALQKKQEDIVKKAEELAANADKQDPKAKPDKKDADKKAADLAKQQDQVAQETRDKVDKAKTDAPADPRTKEMTGKMEDAAKAMREASKKFREGKTDQALAEAEKARDNLKEAAEGAEKVRQEKLAAAIAAAEAQAGALLKKQKELTKDTQAAVEKEKAGDLKGDEQEKEYKKNAMPQAKLKGDAEAVKAKIKDLTEWAAKDAKTDTARQVEDSHKQMTRGQVEQKMANAVVELTGKNGDEAVKEQTKAQTAMEKVLEGLQKASDSMAGDLEAELRRARNEAARADEGLKELGAKPDKAATTQTAAKDPKATTAPAQPDDKAQPPTEERKKELADNLSYELDRLAKHLENRDFADKKDTEFLKNQASDFNRLNHALQNDPAQRNEVAAAVRRVRDRLETEYEAAQEAKRLTAAQREECPPKYRALVNKYFEAMSQVKK